MRKERDPDYQVDWSEFAVLDRHQLHEEDVGLASGEREGRREGGSLYTHTCRSLFYPSHFRSH